MVLAPNLECLIPPLFCAGRANPTSSTAPAQWPRRRPPHHSCLLLSVTRDPAAAQAACPATLWPPSIATLSTSMRPVATSPTIQAQQLRPQRLHAPCCPHHPFCLLVLPPVSSHHRLNAHLSARCLQLHKEHHNGTFAASCLAASVASAQQQQQQQREHRAASALLH